MNFSIKEDLEFRPMADRISILMRSGPTFNNPARVATCLGITEAEVVRSFKESEDAYNRKSKRKSK